MPRINLLPWREALRQKRKKDFMLALVFAILCGGLVAYGSKLTVQSWISNQTARNDILKREIAELDRQIAEISTLETQKSRLLARMEIIDQLQRSRPEVVHLFDELVNILPEGVHLTQVRQNGNRIELRGEAQSNTRVSALMHNIDDSPWLREKPELGIIEGDGSPRRFSLFAQQIPMSENLEETR